MDITRSDIVMELAPSVVGNLTPYIQLVQTVDSRTLTTVERLRIISTLSEDCVAHILNKIPLLLQKCKNVIWCIVLFCA